MFDRVVALVLAATVTGCGVCLQEEYCANEPMSRPPPPPREHYDNSGDDTMLMVGLGVAAVALVVGLVVVAGHSSKSAPVQRSAPPPPPKEVVFAPLPTNAATEGEQLRLQRMYAQGELLARIGRCDGAISIARVLQQNDPAYYAQYAANPTIAACFPP